MYPYYVQTVAKSISKSSLLNSPMDSLLTRIQGCEFCNELVDPKSSRFGRIYAGKLSSRMVAKKSGLIAMPTMGQLFKGSLLVLPIQHIETMAQMPVSMVTTLMIFIAELENQLRPLGRLILFEHGAKNRTGASCGIYHAHMHLWPVPKAISYKTLLPINAQQAGSLIEALQQLQETDHYLLFQDTSGKIAYYEPEEYPSQEIYNSQYFRRALAQYFRVNKPWDWRVYNYPESFVFDTLKWFGRKLGLTQSIPID